MRALAAVRNKIEEVEDEICSEDECDSVSSEIALQKLRSIKSFIDSLTLDDKVGCCQG
jgi:hypothetical protein